MRRCIKAQYKMPVTKFDTATSDALKAAFASNLENGVTASDIKITSATFEVTSKVGR